MKQAKRARMTSRQSSALARADLAARAKASVIVPGWENDLVAAADAYALSFASWAIEHSNNLNKIDKAKLLGWLKAQVEAEHD